MKSKLIVTALDLLRLERVIELFGDGQLAETCADLEMALEEADVVDSRLVAPNVVTMNSLVAYEARDGSRKELRLVYPNQADISLGRLSVLTPVGVALLGRKVGEAFSCKLPQGRIAGLTLREIKYQPEAMGDFHL